MIDSYAKFPRQSGEQGFRQAIGNSPLPYAPTALPGPQLMAANDVPDPTVVHASALPPTPSAAEMAAAQFGKAFDVAVAAPGQLFDALTMTPEKYKAVGDAATQVQKAIGR